MSREERMADNEEEAQKAVERAKQLRLKQELQQQRISPELTIYTVGSVYRHNEFERKRLFALNESLANAIVGGKKAKAATNAGGKSKKAREKKEAEEKAKRDKIMEDAKEMSGGEIPDGYGTYHQQLWG